MAGELVTAYIRLVPTVEGIQGQTARALAPAEKEAGRSGKRAGKAYGRGFTALKVGAVGALVGVAALTKGLSSSIAEAREAQKVGARTANVLKTTGHAANVSAKQVNDLANKLSLKSGVDDEAIQSGENLLLTFKNIRNEAGKGNKIFDRTTQAAVDLAAAMKTDPTSAAKQLGKALNDPAKGLARLARSGVTFTDQQTKQVKAMQKAGDTLGAQKVILKAVEDRFGGAATATATSGEKLKVSFDNLKEQIGTALLPVLDKIATYLTEKVVPAVSAAIKFMQKNPEAVIAFAAALGVLAVAFIAVQVAAFATPLAIAAAVGALVYAYKKSETFRKAVNNLRDGLVKGFSRISSAGKNLYSGLSKGFARIGNAFSNLKNGITTGVSRIKTAFGKMRDFTKSVVSSVGSAWSGIKDAFAAPVNWVITNVINKLISAVNTVARKLGKKGNLINPLGTIGGSSKSNAAPRPRHGGSTGPGFHGGGYTGPGSKYQPAGIVHADEFVFQKTARKRIEKRHPGLLDHANKTGQIEGYAVGGFVNRPDGAVSVNGNRISSIAARQLALAQQVSGIAMRVIQGGYGGNHVAASGTSHNYPGVADVGPGSIALEKILRQVGFAAWARNIPGRSSVGSGAHVHAVSLLDPGDARSPQVTGSWARHGNGLGGSGNDPAPHYPWLKNLKARVGGANLASLGGGGGYDPLGFLTGKIGSISKNASAASGRFGIMGSIVSAVPRFLGRLIKSWIGGQAGKAIGGAASHLPFGIGQGVHLGQSLFRDSGGILPSGLSLVHNNTGAGEFSPVFNQKQASNLSKFVPGGSGSPQSFRITSGALSFDKNGNAYLKGVAQAVYDDNQSFSGSRTRMAG